MRTSLALLASKTVAITEGETAALRERLCIAVEELKALGWPVERIIIRLKQVASEVGFWPLRGLDRPMSNVDRREAIWDDLVKECIEQFYGRGSAAKLDEGLRRHL